MLENPYYHNEDAKHQRAYMRRVILGLLLGSFIGAALIYSVSGRAATPAKPAIVEVVEISGGIGDHTATSMAKMVETVNENPRVKAIVLIVNSPGGGAVASAAAYEELS